MLFELLILELEECLEPAVKAGFLLGFWVGTDFVNTIFNNKNCAIVSCANQSKTAQA